MEELIDLQSEVIELFLNFLRKGINPRLVKIQEIKQQIATLKAEVEREEKEENEPYFGWCDVEGCELPGCSGGVYWRETGYWTICSIHSNMARSGIEQPKMKQEAIEREKRRDKKTGYLINPQNSKI